MDAWGGIDVWVNNAAGLIVKPFLEMTDEDWHGLLAANLHGYFYGCRAAARQMMAGRAGGRIVNVTSVVDIQPIAELVGLRHGEGRHPGADEDARGRARPARHHRQRRSRRARPTRRSTSPPTRRRCGRNYEERIPLGRIAAPEEIADAIALPRLRCRPLRERRRAGRRRRHHPQRQRRPRADVEAV